MHERIQTYMHTRNFHRHSLFLRRRVWRVLTYFAPSYRTPEGTALSPYTDSYASDYPFSVQPDKRISPADLMTIQVQDNFLLIFSPLNFMYDF